MGRPAHTAFRSARSVEFVLREAINDAYQAMIAANTRVERRAACARMTRLVKQRSPDEIAAMEIARGLSKASR